MGADTFPDGAVIRWTASGKYTYVAVKTPVGWYTTALYMNGFVPQKPSWQQLTDILASSETTNIEMATAWSAIDA